jgi:hypothetical protein
MERMTEGKETKIQEMKKSCRRQKRAKGCQTWRRRWRGWKGRWRGWKGGRRDGENVTAD